MNEAGGGYSRDASARGYRRVTRNASKGEGCSIFWKITLILQSLIVEY